MIARLFLLLLGILAVVWLSRWISSARAAERRRRIRQVILWTLAVIVIILALTGRLNWIAALIAALLPLANRLWPLIRYIPLLNYLVKRHKAGRRPQTGTPGGNPSGQTSQVESRFIRMTLDHDSGEISGWILAGQHSGQSLASLTDSQLTELYRLYLQQDAESSRLLAAYLEQRLGPAWHEAEHAHQQSTDTGQTTMDHNEAMAVLGLTETATKQDIIDAHRRLMQKLHPDRGGSDYLAAKINLAKEILLGKVG